MYQGIANKSNKFTALKCAVFLVWVCGVGVVSSLAGITDVFGADAETVLMRVTAYCACGKCCGEYSDGITASGHRIKDGDMFAAADAKYAFGTEMVIDGYNGGKAVKVLDRGSAIYDNRLDVFFSSHQEALEWGVRHIEVNITEKIQSTK